VASEVQEYNMLTLLVWYLGVAGICWCCDATLEDGLLWPMWLIAILCILLAMTASFKVRVWIELQRIKGD